MAIAGMGVAHERGLRLPRDLSITGLDGSQIGTYIYPSLTTLDNDPTEWGIAAATALLRLVEDGETSNVALPPAGLVVRASTGGARNGPALKRRQGTRQCKDAESCSASSTAAAIVGIARRVRLERREARPTR